MTSELRAELEDRSLIAEWLRDSSTLLTAAALGLLALGFFAWFLAITGQLLPHDLAWLTISEAELRAVADGRLVHFMVHDRAAFGGTLVAIAILDLWLVNVPLRAGRPWAWWTLAGAVVFAMGIGLARPNQRGPSEGGGIEQRPRGLAKRGEHSAVSRTRPTPPSSPARARASPR